MLNVVEGGRRKPSSLSRCKVELRSILHSFPDAAFLFNVHCRIEDFNAPAERLTGQVAGTMSQLDARLLGEQLVREDGSTFGELLVHRALTGQSVRHERCVFHPERGDSLDVLVSENPIRDGSAKIVGALVVVQDVTELSALQRQMASSERHFAVGQMTAGLAHDFNNLLSTISQATYVMEADDLSERDRSMLAIIQNGVRRGAEIVGNIRNYLRGNREVRTRINMDHLLQEVLQLAKPLLDVRPNIDVTTEFSGNCEVYGNAPELRQVFVNLILNAIDAMPKGGTLAIFCALSGPRVLVTVKDTGSGIPFEAQNLIFSPYFTTKSQGTGLGLAGARRTVQGQGGDIRFESTPGKGTTFYIALPPAEGSERTESRAA